MDVTDVRQATAALASAELKESRARPRSANRAEPESAVVTLSADGELDGSGIACKVRTSAALAEAGLHPATGGDGTQRCSGDMLLEALVACAGVTVAGRATSLGMACAARCSAEGDLDFRGTLGVAKDAPVGFRDIRLSFALDTDADADQVATLMKLTERYCVVLQTLTTSPATSVFVSIHLLTGGSR